MKIAFVAFVLSPWIGLAATLAVAATLPKPAPAEMPIVYIDRPAACMWRNAGY
jgi:hypothetical protein